MYLIMTWKSPRYVPFGDKSGHPGLESCKWNNKAISMMRGKSPPSDHIILEKSYCHNRQQTPYTLDCYVVRALKGRSVQIYAKLRKFVQMYIKVCWIQICREPKYILIGSLKNPRWPPRNSVFWHFRFMIFRNWSDSKHKKTYLECPEPVEKNLVNRTIFE